MKKKLKQKILKKRNSMKSGEVIRKSNTIKKKLLSQPEFMKAKTILFYVSFNNEVNTCEMIKELFIEKHIIVPKTDKKKKKIILSYIDCFEDLEIGCFGILEPKKCSSRKVKKKDINLIIVPGVVFDKEGYRIGYGHGYYDKFLKTVKNIPCIGLAYDFQVIGKIPKQSHDMPVHKIITEKRVINIK